MLLFDDVVFELVDAVVADADVVDAAAAGTLLARGVTGDDAAPVFVDDVARCNDALGDAFNLAELLLFDVVVVEVVDDDENALSSVLNGVLTVRVARCSTA